MINFRNFKHIFLIISLCLLGIFGGFFLFLADFFADVNNFFIYRTGEIAGHTPWQDRIYKHQLYTSDNIVIISIGEKDINQIEGGKQETQSLGIPKSYYTQLTKILLDKGAKAVGYDIVFQNRDPHEQEFADLLAKNQNVIIATTSAIKNEYSGLDVEQTCIPDTHNKNIQTCSGMPRSVYSHAHWGLIDMGENKIHSINTLFNTFSKSAARSRSKRPISDDQQKYFLQKIPWKERMYTLPFAMISASGDTKFINIMEEYVKNKENIIRKKQEKNCEKTTAVEDCKKSIALEIPKIFMVQPYFVAHPENNSPYQEISFTALINHPEDFDDEMFAGKYVIVGETGETLHDRFISPASGQYMPGMYSHAFVLDSVLQGKFLEELGEWELFFMIFLLTTIFVCIYFYTPKFISPIIFALSIIAVIYICRYVFDVKNLVVDIMPILMATSLVTYPVTYIYKFFIIERDKRLILHNFSRYLSPSVVKMIDTKNIEMNLGGEKKELSILFSDIAGFTTISEKLDTKDLFRLMTAYLSKMTNILTENHGTLDKYIGDAVMGFYGAPVDDEFHAINACKTAIAMKKALTEINENLQKEWLDAISFRIGIATGEVMVGNIGSENRFNYTVLGDTVNLASRLEWMGKEYGVQTIIASSTRLAIGDQFLVRELDYIAVKWKSEGTRIYELIDEAGINADAGIYATYESALRLYRDGQYLEAGKIFEKIMNIDPPAKVMAMRCLAILKWEMHIENGIFKMTHK